MNEKITKMAYSTHITRNSHTTFYISLSRPYTLVFFFKMLIPELLFITKEIANFQQNITCYKTKKMIILLQSYIKIYHLRILFLPFQIFWSFCYHSLHQVLQKWVLSYHFQILHVLNIEKQYKTALPASIVNDL